MGALARVVAGAFEARNLSLATPEGWLRSILGGQSTYTGKTLSTEAANSFAVVRSCQNVLAQSIMQMPMKVYRRLPDGGKEEARGHYLWPVLHDAPNPNMTADVFREIMMLSLLGHGNFYAEKRHDGSGRVRELWPILPQRVKLRHENRRIKYEIETATGAKTFTRDEIYHVVGMSEDGVTGVSPIRFLRQNIAIGMSLEEYMGRFFANDATPRGGLKLPPGATLTEEAFRRVKADWDEVYGGVENSHRVAVFEDGMEFQQIGMKFEDAQALASRRYEKSEICALYRVPPFLVADMENATYSNIENQDDSFAKHSLAPWALRSEGAANQQLLGPKAEVFCEHVMDAMERGHPAGRISYYKGMAEVASIVPNEIRRRENLNPVPWGEEPVIPGSPQEGDGKTEDGDSETDQGSREAIPISDETSASKSAALTQFEPVILATVGRIVRAEQREVRKALDKGLEAWEIYTSDRFQFGDFIQEALYPIARGLGLATDNLTERYVETSIERLRAAHDPLEEIEEWKTIRPAEVVAIDFAEALGVKHEAIN